MRAGILPTANGYCFNGHPPLGVNATRVAFAATPVSYGFQWAPTLGGECYNCKPDRLRNRHRKFQWAPTLGGECYGIVYLITPPLCQEVNALLNIIPAILNSTLCANLGAI